MLREDIISSFLEMTKKTNELYIREITEAGKAYNLSFAESQLLLFLYEFPQKNTAKDAAESCCFSKAYISKSVEQLVSKEYLEIEVDQKDRRYQHLISTKKAQDYVVQLVDIVMKFFAIASKDIPKEQMELALHMIHVVTRNVENYMQEDK